LLLQGIPTLGASHKGAVEKSRLRRRGLTSLFFFWKKTSWNL